MSKASKKAERSMGGMAGHSMTQAIQPSEVSTVHRRDKTIWLNQVGHLMSHNDAQPRYYSSASWVSSVEDWEQTSPATSSRVQSGLSSPLLEQNAASQKSTEMSADLLDRLVSFGEVDKLVCWFSDYCHLWYPVVDLSEMVSSLESLRNHKPCPAGSAALIAAICYTATCSAEDASDTSMSTLPSSKWLAVAERLLTKSMYPSQPNCNTIRAAFLLAAPNITEATSHATFPPICILVRAAQFLGLHREPIALQISSEEAEFHRVLWWSILSLDMAYSIAHALPPLIHPTNYDVQMLSAQERLDRRLLICLTRVNITLSKILEDIYGTQQPTRASLQRLDKEVEELCASEAPELDRRDSPPGERFLALSQRVCCWKVKFILHQPYLRSTQWPQTSRAKALNASKKYISDFSSSINEPDLAPYRWILNHFNIFHACAIILQDLVQFPSSAESVDLRMAVDSCFSIFYKDADPTWEKLESLRSKAWTANQWHAMNQPALDAGDTSLSDWDPLFASFIWEEAFGPDTDLPMPGTGTCK